MQNLIMKSFMPNLICICLKYNMLDVLKWSMFDQSGTRRDK